MVALAIGAMPPLDARAQAIREDFPIANGTVNAVALSGNTLYLGGAFSSLGPTTGTGVPVSLASGLPVAGFPRVSGQVNAVVSDGSGGWFIGGQFATVGGQARANLAHVLSDNSVAAWNPGVNGQVLALAFDGATLYAGGSFNTVGGFSRSNIAAVDGATGTVSSWDPGAGSSVRAIALGSGVIYLGGSFTSIGATTRNRIAAVSLATGVATSWNPNAGSTVRALASDGSSVFVGGDFTTIGGQSRNRIAAIGVSTGTATSWNPGSNAQVSAIALTGSTLYVGGSFTLIAGQSRSRIAALNTSSGAATSWNPGANAQVLAVAVSGPTVVIGGDFLTVGGQSRSRLAAIDASSGLASSWNPNAYGSVFSLATFGGTVYAGGSFTGMGGVLRNNLAAIDVTTGQVTPWDPDVDSEVLALLVSGGRLYAGGSFTTAAGQTRNGLAAFDVASGLDTGWNPNVAGRVSSLAASAGLVYAGGVFSVVGGQSRTNLAAVDALTGAPRPWNPGTDGEVFSLAVDGSTVYAGGSYMSAGGASRTNLAALDAATGEALAWDPAPNGTVRSIELGCGKVLVGGFFTSIGNQARNRAAMLDPVTGNASSWNPNANGPVYVLKLAGRTVYAAGVLSSIGGQTRNRLAALDLTTGLATPWNPNSTGLVRTLATSPTAVYGGGSFAGIGTTLQTNVAAIDPDNTLSCPAISILPASLGPLTVGTAVSQTLAPSGGVSPYCVTLAGTLPPGLTFSTSTGLLSGTPTTGGTYAFTISATDVNGCTGSQAYSVGVSCPAMAVTPALLPDGALGAPYGQTLSPGGGHAPFTWSVLDGSLPDGLALAPATGLLSGTPATAGSFVFTIGVSDAYGCSASAVYTMDVFATPPASLVAASTSTVCLSAQHPCVSVPFVYSRADSVPARGMSVTFQIDTAKLALCSAGPPAISIQPGPWLDSYPNSFFQVVDNGGGSYTVDQAIFGLPCGVTTGGVLFTVALKAVGPSGTGAIEVTRVKARDCDNGGIAAAPGPIAMLTVHATPVAVQPDTLPDAPVNQPYAQTLTAAPGATPFAFAVTSGALPPGLALAPTGELTGTPNTYGAYAFTVTATDAGGCTGSRAYTIEVVCPLMTVEPATLPNALVGVLYSQTLSHAGGPDPVTFAVTAGALPAGLSLAPDGTLSGTPGTLGTSSFTIRATGPGGCIAERAYDVAVTCPAMAIIPAQFPNGVLGVPYTQPASSSAGIAPFTWTITDGSLPAGLALDGSTGEISGTPTTVSITNFTLQVADAFGCTASEACEISIYPEEPASAVSADATGLCLSTAHAFVAVPFLFARGETTPALGVSVTFQLETSKLALRTPGTPAASVHMGSWTDAFGNGVLQVVDRGGGRYTADVVLLGSPCGITTGGTLFTVDVASAGGDGPGTISVVGVSARDCGNLPIGVHGGLPTQVSIQHAAPSAISDLASEQVAVGNPPGATTGIRLTWATGGGANAKLYRAPFGSYPLYDANGPVLPPDASAAPGAPWTLAAASAASGYVDYPPSRGWWHYVAFAIDSCGNLAAVSNETPGALDYHLGDVSNGAVQGQGDNVVSDPDVSLLGANYGIGEPAITTRGVAYLDVGPTMDYLPTSRPHPDHVIDFEDLILFAANYQVTSGPSLPQMPNSSNAIEIFRVSAPGYATTGQVVNAVVSVTASGRVQGFSAGLIWNPAVVQPVSAAATPWFAGQDGLVLSPSSGRVDAALLGARDPGLFGTVDVVNLSFQAVGTGEPGIVLQGVVARDAWNRPLPVEVAVTGVEPGAAPRATALASPWPNPARAGTLVGFALERRGPVEVAIYGVDGRLVKMLAQGEREPGEYRLPWDGTNERGTPSAPGVYYVRLKAGGREFTRKLVRLDR